MLIDFILNNEEFSIELPAWTYTIAQLKNNIIGKNNNYKFSDLYVTFQENNTIYETKNDDLLVSTIEYIITTKEY
jgi:hypothetical protein